MATSADNIQLVITLENGQFKVASKEVQSSMAGMGAGVKNAGDATGAGTASMGKGIGSLAALVKGFIGLQVVQFFLGIGKAAIKGAADLEKNTVAFETMLGSQKKAAVLMGEIKKKAAETPLETTDFVEGAKRLIAFGESSETVVATMTRLGDAAMGDAATFDRLTLAYGKTQAKQKATMEELNMFTEAGVPIVQALADKFGVSAGAMMKMVEQGKVGFKDVDQALTNLTTGTGKFAGMMEKQSKTLGGLLSTLKDNFTIMLTDLGMSALPGIKKLVEALSGGAEEGGKFAGALKTIGEFLGSIAGLIADIILLFNKLEAKFQILSKAGDLMKMSPLYATYKYTKTVLGLISGDDGKTKIQTESPEKPGVIPKSVPAFSGVPGPAAKALSKDELLNKEIQKYMNYFNQITSFSSQMLSSVTSNLEMAAQREAQILEERKQMWDAAVDYWYNTQIKKQGLEEETASVKSAKELDRLNQQYARTGNVIRRANLGDEIEAKRHEHQKNKLQEEAEKKKHNIELVYAILKHQMAVREFRRNQQTQYAAASMQMAQGMIAAMAGGIATVPVPVFVGAAIGAAMAAVVAGMGAWSISEISRQQPPMMASGGFVLGSQSGTSIIAGDRSGTEAIVPLDNDEQMEKFREKTGAGPQVNINVQGHITDAAGFGRLIRDTFSANGWNIKTRGAY